MGKFSEQEILKLRANVNVTCVTEHEIMFSEEFKQYAWEEKKKGKKLPEIFRESGIDPQVLGHKRVENFSRRLREKARNNSAFPDVPGADPLLTPYRKEVRPEDRIRQLEHELAYARQEVEFLKKIQAANTEARKRWESKHRPE